MEKSELLFYDGYEDFYTMASESTVFQRYCKEVYGRDFSQDGFSDVNQINDIMSLGRISAKDKVLDIGCGNGKMLQYIQQQTKAKVWGFDYSDNAIQYANQYVNDNSGAFHFQTGIIGEIGYPAHSFDVITSIDSIYFATNMSSFINQVISWLKPNGCFVCAYQEGDVMKKTDNQHTTLFATILKQYGIKYDVIDYTKQTYELLLKKREVVESMKQDFIQANIEMWYDVAVSQSLNSSVNYEDYVLKNSRYIYVVTK